MQITHHFHLNEFMCRDGTPYPPDWIAERLRPLCLDLETLRTEFGKPIYITSGYRTLDYNRAIGGARFSQHMVGRAADIIVVGVAPERVQARVYQLLFDLHYFHSITALGRYPTFTHVDTRGGRLINFHGARVAN